jgi:hypothetical protein
VCDRPSERLAGYVVPDTEPGLVGLVPQVEIVETLAVRLGGVTYRYDWTELDVEQRARVREHVDIGRHKVHVSMVDSAPRRPARRCGAVLEDYDILTISGPEACTEIVAETFGGGEFALRKTCEGYDVLRRDREQPARYEGAN